MSMTTTLEHIHDLIQRGDVSKAENELNSATNDVVDAIDRRLYHAIILEKQCRWHEAVQAYERVLEQDPQHTEAAFKLAVLADRFGEDERAIELYEIVTSEPPTHVNALLNLAVLYEDDERYRDALTCIDRILAEYPNHSRAGSYLKDIESSLDMYYDEDRERYREKRNALLETPISDFELGVRSRNCLKQMDINNLGDLLRTTASELLSYKNFGETSLHEIETMLTQKNLRLGQLLDEKEGDWNPSIGNLTGSTSGQSNLLNRSVAEMELSVRARKCLMRLGVASIGELVQHSEAELLAIKNFGGTSLSEIKRRLTELGLDLKA